MARKSRVTKTKSRSASKVKKIRTKKTSLSVLRDIEPKTLGQKTFIEAIKSNPIVICDGPAGTGKTFISFGYALKYFLEGEVRRIIIVRPTVTSGENEPDLGALPGDLNEKMGPFIAPLIRDSAPLLLNPETYRKMPGVDPLESLLSMFDIEVVPLHFMRGRTFHNAFVILDEAQNCTLKDFKLFLTRIGRNSRVVIEGDSTQKDKLKGALPEVLDALEGLEGIATVRLEPSDIIRNPMLWKIIQRLDRVS